MRKKKSEVRTTNKYGISYLLKTEATTVAVEKVSGSCWVQLPPIGVSPQELVAFLSVLLMYLPPPSLAVAQCVCSCVYLTQTS